ncbi:hypothetical protein [Halomonas sp. C22]|uniref:hypothetical protein n=1 Tax=Halomonas sp. C22 TaxID=2580567 RepID=UPI0011A41B46|nr:hypothetical protein [Halomonas sp. C22]
MQCFDEVLKEGVHRVTYNNVSFNVCVQGDFFSDFDVFLAGFHGAIRNRAKTTPPYFHFRGVAKQIDIPLVSFSDPSLEKNEAINLAWFIGDEVESKLTSAIASFLDYVVSSKNSKVILSGGSGGGFAALNIHSMMRNQDKAYSFVWNPQIKAYDYNSAFSKKYINACYESAFKASPYANIKNGDYHYFKKCLDSEVNFTDGQKSIIFINGYDQNHLRKQIRGILDESSVLEFSDSSYKYRDRYIYVGEWGYGHVPPPKNVIIKVIKKIKEYGFDGVSIGFLESMEQSNKENLIFSETGSFRKENFSIYSTLLDDKLIVRSNLSELYKGFQLEFSLVYIGSNEVLSASGFLMGSYLLQAVFKLKDKSMIGKLHIRATIEDFYGRKTIIEHPLRKTVFPNKIVGG